MVPKSLDEDALQKYLFDRTNRYGQIEVHQLELSKSLGVDNDTLCNYLKRMVKTGRLRFVKKGRLALNTYFVENPYPPEETPAAVEPTKPKVRQIMWQ